MRPHLPSLLALAALAWPAAVKAQDISLRLPVACEVGRSCFVQNYVDRDASPAAGDYQCGTLTYDTHDGTDIRVPTLAAQKAGVDVVAAADGAVLRTRARTNPLYISPGHLMDVEHAVQFVMACCTTYRLPEPTRWAHKVAGGEKLPGASDSQPQLF